MPRKDNKVKHTSRLVLCSDTDGKPCLMRLDKDGNTTGSPIYYVEFEIGERSMVIESRDN